MREKAKRVDTTGPASSLTSNPFSALGAALPAKLAESPGPVPPRDDTRDAKPCPEFRIARTRKGDYPIFLERRAAGKTVTIIRNLSGNTSALLVLLKKHCATGGKAFADSLEIQGDHRSRVTAFLREKGL